MVRLMLCGAAHPTSQVAAASSDIAEQRQETFTASRGASRDMNPAWGHGKTAVPQILTKGNGGPTSLRFQNTSPLLLSRGHVENPCDNYKAHKVKQFRCD